MPTQHFYFDLSYNDKAMKRKHIYIWVTEFFSCTQMSLYETMNWDQNKYPIFAKKNMPVYYFILHVTIQFMYLYLVDHDLSLLSDKMVRKVLMSNIGTQYLHMRLSTQKR